MIEKQDFASEAVFVESFVRALRTGRTRFRTVQVGTEWNHTAGFVDVLARRGANTLMAFEAKLSDWRRALGQAYRNTAYADLAFVLLPPAVAKRALVGRREFEVLGIGLCTFDGNQIKVLIDAAEQRTPLLKWVRQRAHDYFNNLSDGNRARP